MIINVESLTVAFGLIFFFFFCSCIHAFNVTFGRCRITYRHKQRQEHGDERMQKNLVDGEPERQINASLVLQCIRTRITVVTAAPVSPLTEKNYKYYHLHH